MPWVMNFAARSLWKGPSGSREQFPLALREVAAAPGLIGGAARESRP